jgi:hypothetical protein
VKKWAENELRFRPREQLRKNIMQTTGQRKKILLTDAIRELIFHILQLRYRYKSTHQEGLMN